MTVLTTIFLFHQNFSYNQIEKKSNKLLLKDSPNFYFDGEIPKIIRSK